MAIATVRSTLWWMTLFAAVTSGLMAGVFFSFSNFMMAAMDATPPTQAIATMQSINVKIVNPLFMVVLVGPAVCSVLLAVSCLVWPGLPGRFWLLAGCVLYVVGAMAVTGVFNVPLNNGLASLPVLHTEQAHAAWAAFRSPWQAWNHVRTVTSVIASACFWMALGAMRQLA